MVLSVPLYIILVVTSQKCNLSSFVLLVLHILIPIHVITIVV